MADDSDADLGHVLGAVAPIGRNSDADMAEVAEAAQRRCRERFCRHSRLLAQHTRACKELRRLSRLGQVAPHVEASIERRSQDFAKTPEDLILVTEKKPRVIRGRGAYKKRLQTALQRVCWGVKLRIRARQKCRPTRRIRGKRALASATAPTTASTRIYALLGQSSSKHA